MTERAADAAAEAAPTCSSSTSTSPTDLEARRRRPARALGPRRRRPARDRLRARGRARRQLPRHAARERDRPRSRRSAFSLKALAAALADLYPGGGRARSSGWTSTRRSPGRSTTGWAWPRPRWRPISRYLARDLGPRGVRVNLVSAGPARARSPRAASRASATSPTRGSARRRWAGTPRTRPGRRRRAASCSRDLARAITGEILHVDGGFHAMGTRSTRAAAGRGGG